MLTITYMFDKNVELVLYSFALLMFSANDQSENSPVSGLSSPSPASRSTVLFKSSDVGSFSDTRPQSSPRDFSWRRQIGKKKKEFYLRKLFGKTARYLTS